MKTLSNKSIRKQFFIISVLSTLIPVLILSVFSLTFLQNNVVKQTEQRLEETLTTVNSLYTESLNEHRQKVNGLTYMLAKEELLIDFEDNQKTISTILHQLLMGNDAEMNLYVLDTHGNYAGTRDLPELYELPIYQNWGIFKRLNESSKPEFYANYRREDGFFTAYSIAQKIEHEDEKFYVILDVSTEHIQKLINSVKGSEDRIVQFIITTKGNEIIYNDSMFTSPISYLDNVFRFDRLDVKDDDPSKHKLDEVTVLSKGNYDEGIMIYGMIPKTVYNSQVRMLSISTFIIVLLTALLSGVLIFFFNNRFSKPIYALVRKAQNYRPYDLETYEKINNKNELKELEEQFDKMICRIEKYRVEDLKKQELLRSSEIKSLMSQINPHFLNNTLDTIKWKAKLSGEDEIAELTTELGVLLKASMNTNLYVTVEEELAFIDSYLALQIARYNEKLNYTENIDHSVLNVLIPKLLIQPIIENSIIHGIEPSLINCDVNLTIVKDDKYLYFHIYDSGVGSDYDIETVDDKIGLKNVKERLELHYGDGASVTFESKKSEGALVSIKIELDLLEVKYV